MKRIPEKEKGGERRATLLCLPPHPGIFFYLIDYGEGLAMVEN